VGYSHEEKECAAHAELCWMRVLATCCRALRAILSARNRGEGAAATESVIKETVVDKLVMLLSSNGSIPLSAVTILGSCCSTAEQKKWILERAGVRILSWPRSQEWPPPLLYAPAAQSSVPSFTCSLVIMLPAWWLTRWGSFQVRKMLPLLGNRQDGRQLECVLSTLAAWTHGSAEMSAEVSDAMVRASWAHFRISSERRGS
jgi:hypothetical protein